MKDHIYNPGDIIKRYRLFLTCFLASVALLFIAMSGRASAADILVNTLTDDGTAGNNLCSLREAINNANADSDTTGGDCAEGSGADTITFSVAGRIPLTSQLVISDAAGLTIDGGSLVTISGNNLERVFNVDVGASLTLENLTVSDGVTIFFGGGIFNAGTLAITNSTLSGNTAQGGSGGGGIFNSGTLTITNSTLSGNSAAGSGGGIFNQGAVTITNSTLSGNTASDDGGGIFNTTNAGGTVTVTNSTLSGNSASDGGGIFNDEGQVEITNSTLSGNSADFGGGGIFNRPAGTLWITNTTLSGNSAGVGFTGGGILNLGTLTITNSIVANSPSGGDCSILGTFTALGHNLDTDGTCPAVPAFATVSPAQLNLGPLFFNGGPTNTHALLPGSFAINSGDQGECIADGITTDQRGFSRDGACDIGAYEFGAGPKADLLISQGVNKTTVKQGDLLTYTVTVQNFGPDTAANVVVNDTLSSGTTFVSANVSKGAITTKPLVGQTGTVTWSLGDMLNADDESATIEVKVIVKGKTTITNTATVSSATADPNPANNTAAITVSVASGPSGLGKKK